MRFILEVELGNVAMCNRAHIANALRQVARKLLTNSSYRQDGDESKIMDVNGNSVGSFRFTES